MEITGSFQMIYNISEEYYEIETKLFIQKKTRQWQAYS